MAKVTKQRLGLDIKYDKKLGDRPFSEAVKQATLRMYQTGEGRYEARLHKIARKLVEMAEEGDMLAIRTVMTSMDGRPPLVQIDNSKHIHIGEAIGELMARRKVADQRKYVSGPTLAGESSIASCEPPEQAESVDDGVDEG